MQRPANDNNGIVCQQFQSGHRRTGTLTIGIRGDGAGTYTATFTGGVTGNNSLTLDNNGGDEKLTFSTGALNNAGTITHIGAGTGDADHQLGHRHERDRRDPEQRDLEAGAQRDEYLHRDDDRQRAGTLVAGNGQAIPDTGLVSIADVAGATVPVEQQRDHRQLDRRRHNRRHCEPAGQHADVRGCQQSGFRRRHQRQRRGLDRSRAPAPSPSGANTFTGGVTLNSGTLNINSTGTAGVNGPLGNGGTFRINGGTIDNTSGTLKALLNVNPIIVGGDFAFSTAAGTANNNLSLPGTVNLDGVARTVTANGGGVLYLGGVVSNGSLIKAGTGEMSTAQ